MDIQLADLLKSLREEINRARLDAAGKDVRFRITSIDLELQVVVEKTNEAQSGVRFWVVSLGGKRGGTSAETQVVKLSLIAETDSGGPILTSDVISDPFSEG